jgi:hypothetical protein
MSPAGETCHRSQSARAALLLATAVVTIALFATLAQICLAAGLIWRCPSIALFGIPCPSCGSTRALAALSHFHLADAIRFNPLLVLLLALGPVAAIWRKQCAKFFSWGWGIVLAAVFLNWIYLLLFLPR